MNKTSVVLTAALLMGAISAHAADTVTGEQPPVAADNPIGSFSWGGYYVGVNLGYGFGGDGEINSIGQLGPNIANIETGARPGSVDLDRDGVLGGIQTGYNWQSGAFVYGVEADFSFADLKDSGDFVTPQINTGLAQSNVFNSEIDYLGTVRGRLGFALDRTLIYGTGGLAFGETTSSVDMFAPTGVKQFTGENSDTQFGYAVGVGVEHAITERLTLKTEYLYYDLGDETVNVQAIPGTGVAGGYDSTFNNDGHLIRIGLNYKF